MKCIILAGGELTGDLKEELKTNFRSEFVWQGKSFLQIAIEAVQPFGEVIVVGGEHRSDVQWIEGGKTFLESFSKGVRAGEGERNLLMLSADLPFLTQNAVKEFIEKSDENNVINYSIVNVDAVDLKFPGMARTSLGLQEGVFTGGNLFLLNRDLMLKILPKIQSVYDARKSPIKLASLLGFSTFLVVLRARFFPKWSPICGIEKVVGKALGAPVKAIICEHPEIAADIDNSRHFAWLKTL